MTRIAVVDKEKCHPGKCSRECINFCPVNRQGKDCIVLSEDEDLAEINEELCTGCGICVKKCPFGAITIINKPEEAVEAVHRYGMNAFRIYGLPTPHEGVTGLIGKNGIGKSTIIKILSGNLKPNMGKYNEENSWEDILEHYKGTELYNYLKKVVDGEIKTAYKPQTVSRIPKAHSGKVSDLLEKVNEKEEKLEEYKDKLDLSGCWNKEIKDVSGGELQRIAICATLVREADLYFIDEPSSYLDIKQRMKVAELIREVGEEKKVMVVEHDLAILDYLTDQIYVLYGVPGVYGVLSGLKSSRKGINEFLDGFLDEENVRIRKYGINFETKPPKTQYKGENSISYPEFSKEYPGFSLEADSGKLKLSEVIGVIGENAIGKSTFVKVLAGEINSKEENVDIDAKISYKPQYITFEEGEREMNVENFIATRKNFDRELFNSRLKKLVEDLYPKKVKELSGGEKQKLAVAVALAEESDLCLLDEPSAFLDIEQRFQISKVIKRVTENKENATVVVDHDLLFQDMVSNRLMRFTGKPGKEGKAHSPVTRKKGMSEFLKSLGITMRREPRTGRPRINKKDSQKDIEQKKKNEYYYTIN